MSNQQPVGNIQFEYEPPFPAPNAMSQRTIVQALPGGKRYLADKETAVGVKYVNVLVTRVLRDGARDTGFNSTGWQAEHIEIDSYQASVGLLQQSDGGVIVSVSNQLSTAASSLALLRYQENGELDKNFGNNGKIIHAIPLDVGLSRLVDQDQESKAVPGGFGALVPGDNGRFFSLVRNRSGILSRLVSLHPDGQLNLDFGTDGIVPITHPTRAIRTHGITVASDGAIMAVGGLEGSVGAFLARYTAEGALDQSFGESGFVIFNAKAAGDLESKVVSIGLTSVAALDGGAAVACGSLGVTSPAGPISYGLVVCVNSQGAPLTSFNAGKALLFGPPKTQFIKLNKVVVQADGKIVVGGELNLIDSSILVARFLPDGQADKGFFRSGWTTFKPYKAWHCAIADLALDPQGSEILVTGSGGSNPSVQYQQSIVVQLG
ncbi:hypothetical protein NJC38_05460 [Pseudomonas sp. 21LCFQ010]|uniref:hypothetical protein n=1 Tax=Pseudomonas sp. 21LCFQ010 TaxID=2957506 RepID=UPI002096F15F|nr:hypothetical protein [Pseudomonas sp. 21LCFQ010]MCO8161600.1 hypothetical protein [Pseudomonas sp. 21LCFQ010]